MLRLSSSARRLVQSSQAGTKRSLSEPTRAVVGREARRAKRGEAAGASGMMTTSILWGGVYSGLAGVLVGGAWLLTADKGQHEWPKKAQESVVGSWLIEQVEKLSSPFSDPSREKLLPDWPPDYLNISPDVPCPHTLVVDLEETLVRATWDRRHGWRHAKRPGADNFLREMSKYYEIVIFTGNIAGVADPVIHSLDKEGCAMHRLYRDATRYHRGSHCKDLAMMNRDPRKIVMIDDDPNAVQLQPGNAVLVKPYIDAADRADTELEDLIPFLAALVNEGVRDVPAAIAKFSDNKATTVAAEYAAMLADSKKKADTVRSIGLGGFVRGAAPTKAPARPAFDSPLTAKDIVGDAPPSEEAATKKGWLWRSFEERSKVAEEQNKLKMEAWQKSLQKKEQAKRMAAEQA